MLHKVSKHLSEYDLFFTSYYGDRIISGLQKTGLLNFSILGGKMKLFTEKYLKENNLKIDYKGKKNDYDLVVTSSDLIIPRNIRGKKIVLVQEGMTDPPNLFYYLVKYLKFPRWSASTSTVGLSDAYTHFCVASDGYKEHFVKIGCNPEKILVTGIPNFDNCEEFLDNNFPHKDYVLVCTSDARETFKAENRKKFLRYCRDVADGKQIIIKLHPNENTKRAIREINDVIPDAIVYPTGNTNEMIANCSVLITMYSSVVYIGLALGKEVYSRFDINLLKKLLPIQNKGTSGSNIAEICKKLINEGK